MSTQDIIELIDEGVRNGRIAPYLADYIAEEMLQDEPRQSVYDERVRLDIEQATEARQV